MINLACGTCGISMLSSALPPFHFWILLLPVAFVAYQIILKREGKLSTWTLLLNILAAGIAFLASVAMLAVIIVPLAFLFLFINLLKRLKSEDQRVRKIAATLLGLYLASGILTLGMAKYQGSYWQLTRIHGGGPGTSYYRETAKNQVFSRTQLLEYLRSDKSMVSSNARGIIQQMASLETDPAEAEAFFQSLKAIDSDTARRYKESLSFPSEEAEEPEPEPEPASPSPSASPTS
jgi:glucan phosphoethanolaminetransferase (alkaline phosphatase superfamily)